MLDPVRERLVCQATRDKAFVEFGQHPIPVGV